MVGEKNVGRRVIEEDSFFLYFLRNWVIFQKCWEEEEEEEREEEEGRLGTEAPVGHKKCNTKQKKALKEMTSHSPSFLFFISGLLPRLVLETVGGCRDTMGSPHTQCSPAQWRDGMGIRWGVLTLT